MKRTFIALKMDPDPSFSQFLRELQKKIEGNLRWVDPENLHLTIRFIGNTEDFQFLNICERMDDLIPRFDSFDLEIKGLGIFGSARLPKILWAGVKMPEYSFRMVEGIEDIVCRTGFEAETRIYSPHLTLCRIRDLKSPFTLNDIVKAFKETSFFKQRVTKIIFYESLLQRTGSVYNPLHTFSLRN